MAANWNAAMAAMIVVSGVGFLLSDGEKRRVRWVQAMRRCLLRLCSVIRYEQPPLAELLARADLHATPQERALTRMLHACAGALRDKPDARLALLFAEESAKLAEYGVLSLEDRQAFEAVMAELGSLCLSEQLRLMDEADERLRCREEVLSRECAQRTRLLRTLGAAGGAAAFLILI